MGFISKVNDNMNYIDALMDEKPAFGIANR